MRYRTVQWAQTSVSRVTRLRSPPFPLYPSPLELQHCNSHSLLSALLGRSSRQRLLSACLTALSHKQRIEGQMTVGATTPLNRPYCSCQHLTRSYFITQEEHNSMSGEAKSTWATIRRVYNVIFTATSQHRKLWDRSLPLKNSLMVCFVFCKVSNWIPPSSQHPFLHTEVIVV